MICKHSEHSYFGHINPGVLYTLMMRLVYITLKLKQSKESIVIKGWTLTSGKKINNSHGSLIYHRMELIFTLHALSILI